ncbi:hypothetical protein GF380_03000 [Candidatus Uhrbacteria bacterium]|nr:hypothetical protein [Candidatus Uhrbacteria bacterium]MBD3284116.1 hypothetical protein [Candidatus Uhrbacteria bacterium]
MLTKHLPKQPYDYTSGSKKEHGEPCVATTPYANIAIFRSLVYTDRSSFGSYEDGRLEFKASKQALEDAKSHTGYIYVLRKEGFAPYGPEEKTMEWRSPNAMKPEKVIKVTPDDLPPNIQEIKP